MGVEATFAPHYLSQQWHTPNRKSLHIPLHTPLELLRPLRGHYSRPIRMRPLVSSPRTRPWPLQRLPCRCSTPRTQKPSRPVEGLEWGLGTVAERVVRNAAEQIHRRIAAAQILCDVRGPNPSRSLLLVSLKVFLYLGQDARKARRWKKYTHGMSDQCTPNGTHG